MGMSVWESQGTLGPLIFDCGFPVLLRRNPRVNKRVFWQQIQKNRETAGAKGKGYCDCSVVRSETVEGRRGW